MSLLAMLHRALPTAGGHETRTKQNCARLVCLSMLARSSCRVWRIGPRALLRCRSAIGISAIAEKLLARGIGAMRPRLLLTSCLYAVAGARRPPPTDAITQKHVGDNQLNAYAIGAGFEGSASDWTEYVVWTVGVAALIFYLSGVVKIDVYNIDEEPAAAQEPGAIAVRVLESLDDMALVASIKEVITKTVRESNEKNELSSVCQGGAQSVLGRATLDTCSRAIYVTSIPACRAAVARAWAGLTDAPPAFRAAASAPRSCEISPARACSKRASVPAGQAGLGRAFLRRCARRPTTPRPIPGIARGRHGANVMRGAAAYGGKWRSPVPGTVASRAGWRSKTLESA